jgi:DNA-binding CsgD family transcriptional regulator
MLYGRDSERARIGELLEAARASRSAALVLRGEAGIGKSALLEDTRERAAGMHVLAARGVESESELAFAALHQLLRPALGDVDRLPPPQATALRSALGLEEGGGQKRFLVFSACLSLLSELADRRPVLCLVDDAHWLDAASADALQFVARRLDAEGIVLLFAAREGDVRAFEAADVPSLELSGLDAQASAVLLARGTVDIAASVREHLVAQTQGNALALVELPSALSAAQLAGWEPLPEVLPMTQQLESVFHERAGRLPEETRLLLLVAAADDSEDVGVVNHAARALGAGPRALDAAEQAGLIVVHGARLEFRHPLVRSAVYGAAASGERRAAHRALADAVLGNGANADRRAWHLAASAVEHDEGIVQALEEAAMRAETRGGHVVASRMLERAAALSADDHARGRRLAGAARCASVACADERAVALARQALPLVDEPLSRAEITQVVGLAEIRRGRPGEALSPLLEAAREVASLDSGKAVELLLDASWAAADSDDPEGQGEICRVATAMTLPAEDERSVFFGGLLSGIGALGEGDAERAAALLGKAVAWGFVADDPRQVMWVGAGASWLGDDEQASALWSRAGSLARARGEIGILVPALGALGMQRFLAQRFDEAAIVTAEALELAREVRGANMEAFTLGISAGIAAVRGEDEDARARADEALEAATARGLPIVKAFSLWALATVDLGRGRWADALERLGALGGPPGFVDAVLISALPDRVEAAVRASRLEGAQVALDDFEARSAQLGVAWTPPRLASCRALVSGGEEATAHFEEALSLQATARPFDLARIQLLYGEHLRRERRRTDARVQLRGALEAFERFRAEPWAERTRAELRASGETVRRRDPSTLGQLTPQELQIAGFVAEGLTNKEIAAQLFLSPRTIDAHLRSIFSKLSITSRTQLARLPLGEQEAVSTLPVATA